MPAQSKRRGQKSQHLPPSQVFEQLSAHTLHGVFQEASGLQQQLSSLPAQNSPSTAQGLAQMLKLTQVEAMLLVHGLRIMHIWCNGSFIDAQGLWALFVEQDRDFVWNYAAFHHFRAKGYIARPGLQLANQVSKRLLLLHIHKSMPNLPHGELESFANFSVEERVTHRWVPQAEINK
ncbi:hypothetical protein WJX73_006261 [Symbiochloris irregularis]|uniref:Uncharacterized protein n=1 Tax=Symbiochloris irregularis TaxID=706552 RepID=A0AAW1PCV5_9CHLO